MLQRFITGAILVAALIVVLALGGWVFALTAAAAVCIGMREEYHALTLAGHRPVQWPTWVGIAAAIPLLLTYSYRTIVPLLLLVCFVTFVIVLFRDNPRLEDALLSIMPLLTVTLPGMFLISLLAIEPKSLQVTLFSLIFAVSILGDTLAYFVGSRVKGPKLCPAVSPAKTVSGAVGGLIGSVLGAFLVGLIAYVTLPANRAVLPTALEYLLIGLLGGFAGQVGDLFASLVKRHCGVKDFSGIFPGHGGMMDRMDSILFVSLVVFCYRIIFI